MMTSFILHPSLPLQAQLHQHAQEVLFTQSILSSLRRAGTLPGINPYPMDHHHDPPMETDTEVTLHPRPGGVVIINTSKSRDESNRVSYFTIDLKRFRSVEVIRCGGVLGPQGGVALAGDLNDKCGGRVHTMDLRGSRIGRLGLDALSQALVGENGRLITTMILRNCDITGESMVCLGQTLKKGGLPLLQHLDLQSNLLQDHGACHLASMFFSRSFHSLQRLLLQHCSIRDTGAVAIYRAFASDIANCPTIVEINLRYNRVSPHGYRRIHPCPPCLTV